MLIENSEGELMQKKLQTIRLLPLYALYLGTFGLAAGTKILGFPAVPQWFNETFAGTFLAASPSLLGLSFYFIAGLESFTFLCFATSFIKGEFKPNRTRPILYFALWMASLTFVALGLGLRLARNYSGAADLFAYFGATLVAMIYADRN